MDKNTPLNTALIIFVRHPELGSVKTRLAKVIGEEKTLHVYNLLLEHTRTVTRPVNCRKFVYYAGSIPEHDQWDLPGYTKRQQFGADLGERMLNAFTELFKQGFKRIMIIGSDCYQLRPAHLDSAVSSLEENDAVIGPTFDGGYYLLGMNMLTPEIFRDKAWSSSLVAKQTIETFTRHNLSYHVLRQLHDVDEAADLEINGIYI
ncbi:MAG: TIGR04282 family arsenosugar biosynthesis glycosyltransferase [Daejeonella sp.]